jgi:hypothetical protein
MPSTDRKLELKAKTSMAQAASQAAVYAKGLICSLKYIQDLKVSPNSLFWGSLVGFTNIRIKPVLMGWCSVLF